MTSALTIHKHILKREYEKSPLGQAEKKIRQHMDSIKLGRRDISDEDLKAISAIRNENEAKIEAYIKERNRLDREAIDNMLLESMSKELVILEANKTTTPMTND